MQFTIVTIVGLLYVICTAGPFGQLGQYVSNYAFMAFGTGKFIHFTYFVLPLVGTGRIEPFDANPLWAVLGGRRLNIHWG